MAFLTSRTLATGITLSDLFHIVKPYDISQNPAGSSYKANVQQLFDSISGYCISDLYVTNIHGCSPIHIQPTSSDDVYLVEGGGNVGIGVTSATTRLHVSGTTIINSDYTMLSDTLTSIPPSPNFKGFIVTQDFNNLSGYLSYNSNTSGGTGLFAFNDSSVQGQLFVGGSQYLKSGVAIVPLDFYQNKVIVKGSSSSEGMVFNAAASNPSSTFWWEFNAASGMILKGNGLSTGAYLGLALNPDGSEMPTSNLQIGGTGTTGTFQYKDGNEQNGYVLKSDVNGNATWQSITPGPTIYGLFAQTGNSVVVSGTTGETSIIGGGVGTLTVPANGFSVGDSFAVRISGDIGANNGTNLTLRVKSGSVVFGQVGPISMPNVTSSHFSFEITFTIRALGTAGNAQILSSGYFTFTQNAGGSFEGDNFSTLNDTTFDTTSGNTLNVTAQFNSTNSANFIFTELLVLNKIF